MRICRLYLFLFAASISGTASIHAALLEHEAPPDVIRSEKALIEVTSFEPGDAIYDMRVFYRHLGEERYRSIPMKCEGYIYTAEIPTSDATSGRIEYYIAYEGRLGSIGTLPEVDPQRDPYTIRIAPAQIAEETTDIEVVILSPQPEDIVPDDEVLIAASVIGGESKIDFSLSKLYLDEVDVTGASDFSEGLLTYVPPRMQVGRHIIQLQLYDDAGELLTTEEWAFRVMQKDVGAPGFNIRGSLVVDNRNQTFSGDKDNYFLSSGHLAGNYGKLDFYTKLLLSSEESKDRQPANRYTGELRYHLTNRSSIYLNGGDFIPYYNPLAFQDKRVRGVQGGFLLGFFTLDFILGYNNRAVEGSIEVDDEGETTQNYGTYAEKIMAIRPGFRFGDNVRWNLNLINSKEDPGSIDYGSSAKEAFIIGSDLFMNFDRRRILLEASLQASVKNTDAGAPEIEFEELKEVDSTIVDNALAEKAFDFFTKTGFLTPTTGLSLLPSMAFQVDLQLKYFNNNMRLTYLNINSEFENPGNPYLLKDIAGFYFTDAIRLFRNSLFLNLYFKKYVDNFGEEAFKTNNLQYGTTLSFFPLRSLPSLTLGYDKYSRDNGVTTADTASGGGYLYIEDNDTRRLSVATAYDIEFGKFSNKLLLSYADYRREDIATPEGNSEFNTFTVGLRTKFPFPLVTRLSYMQSGTSYGDTSTTVTDVNRFNMRLEYRLKDLFGGDMLRPFVNLSLQNIDYDIPESGITKTDRFHFAAGLIYRTPSFGTLTFRYDHIKYDDMEGDNINDRILHARYEIHF